MTRAGQQNKRARETKTLVVDCSPLLADGETITAIGTPTQDTNPVDGDPLTFAGLAANSVRLAYTNATDIEIGVGIVGFVGGGTPGICYSVTIPFQTSAGQDLDAEFELEVV